MSAEALRLTLTAERRTKLIRMFVNLAKGWLGDQDHSGG